MQNRGDSLIDERLIQDALTEHIDRVDATRDLWPDIRDRAGQRRRARFPLYARVAAATAIVSLLALLVIVRPWSLFDDSITPFAAVAHAYEGLLELETVRYRVDGIDSSGYRFIRNHQIDMVNRIHYNAMQVDTDLAGNALVIEWIIVGGREYKRDWLSGGEWAFSSEPGDWASIGDLVGLPWNRAGAEDRFDQVELMGNVEINGRPAVHYRASKRARPTGAPGNSVVEWDAKSEQVKGAETVHRGTTDYASYVDTVDLWITPDDGRLIKADWTQFEQAPPRPADFNERDWCQGLGEFVEAQYDYRLTSGPPDEVHIRSFDAPTDSDDYQLAKVICWNEGRTEGRVVWGRTQAEELGQDFWVRWVYTFTDFNEPLDLPEDLPE